MKLVSLVIAVVSAIWWGAILLTNIPHLDTLACVMLPEESIGGTLWFHVAFPTAMVTTSGISLVLTTLIDRPGRAILALPFVPAICLLIYYAFFTGISITQTALDACSA